MIDHEPELDDDCQPHPTLRNQTEPNERWNRVVSGETASREISSSHLPDHADRNKNQGGDHQRDIGEPPVGTGQHEKQEVEKKEA